MSEARRRRLLGLLAAGPGVLATIGVLVFSGLELAGRTPSSPGAARNIAEATAASAPSDVLRFLRAGEDPNRIWPVRQNITSSTMTSLTAFEAAIVSRRAPMLELLAREGALVDTEAWQHLACRAIDLAATELVDQLSLGRKPECQYGAAIERVLERARGSRRLQ